jgi:hypothetical protein
MFILDERGRPKEVRDVVMWGKWFETADRRVAADMDEGEGALRVCVSTVFLGLNHNFDEDGPPILWETMVFGGIYNDYQERYASLAAALEGHQRICRMVSEASGGS